MKPEHLGDISGLKCLAGLQGVLVGRGFILNSEPGFQFSKSDRLPASWHEPVSSNWLETSDLGTNCGTNTSNTYLSRESELLDSCFLEVGAQGFHLCLLLLLFLFLLLIDLFNYQHPQSTGGVTRRCKTFHRAAYAHETSVS